jgi:CheY-specific phosphatase CheX
MSKTIPLSDVREFMSGHLVSVFETMLSLKAIPVPNAKALDFGERVTGSVGFAGETVTGAVYLHLSVPLATQAAAAMLNQTSHEITTDAEVNDAVGEATNMLAGGLKSWICDAGNECAVSTPTIIRGSSFSIEPSSEVKRECLIFDCGDDRFTVEVHIKFN